MSKILMNSVQTAYIAQIYHGRYTADHNFTRHLQEQWIPCLVTLSVLDMYLKSYLIGPWEMC